MNIPARTEFGEYGLRLERPWLATAAAQRSRRANSAAVPAAPLAVPVQRSARTVTLFHVSKRSYHVVCRSFRRSSRQRMRCCWSWHTPMTSPCSSHPACTGQWTVVCLYGCCACPTVRGERHPPSHALATPWRMRFAQPHRCSHDRRMHAPSTGNAAGQGRVREKELLKACRLLQVRTLAHAATSCAPRSFPSDMRPPAGARSH